MAERTDLKVGFACNNRCQFCAQGDKRSDTDFIPLAELIDRLKLAHRPGRSLVLTGGEPTLRRDLVKLVVAARAIGYHPIQIQTNGRALAYEQLVDRLIAAGATEFSPALHGPTAELHDSLTRAPGSFDQTVAGIRNVVASRARVISNSVVVRQNLGALTATVELLARLGVGHAQLALVHPVGSSADCFDQVVPPLHEAAPAIAAALRRGQALGLDMVAEAVPACFLRGLEEAVVESRIPDTTVVDLDGEPFAFSDWRRDSGKAKGPPCVNCSRSSSCEGPWREYPEHYGWDDFLPFD